MPVPWLQLVDAALGVANFARGRKAPPPPPEEQSLQLEAGARAPGGLEARLAGVVVAALREAFERDTRRLDLERQQPKPNAIARSGRCGWSCSVRPPIARSRG